MKTEEDCSYPLQLDILDYDELKKEMIKENNGNDISSKFAIRTRPRPRCRCYQDDECEE